MIYLLDVNALIALVDPAHISHETAHDWCHRRGAAAWATCPITEHKVARILGHPKYPNSTGSPAAILPILDRLRSLPGDHFWPDRISVIACNIIDTAEITTAGQVTETYLLALAKPHRGQLATFDRRITARTIRQGQAGLHIIEATH